jgi:hypothetical protein
MPRRETVVGRPYSSLLAHVRGYFERGGTSPREVAPTERRNAQVSKTGYTGTVPWMMHPRGLSPEPPYGRVTNAARFSVLHSVALDVIDRLEQEFDVDRVEPYEHDEDLRGFARAPVVRPTVALVPREGAPLVVAFSSFPGLLVRLGSGYRTAFPSCGCDACDESADGEADRFRQLVHAVTRGQFREFVQVGADGSLTLVWEWESSGKHWREQQLLLEPVDASKVELGPRSQWKPWIGRE